MRPFSHGHDKQHRQTFAGVQQKAAFSRLGLTASDAIDSNLNGLDALETRAIDYYLAILPRSLDTGTSTRLSRQATHCLPMNVSVKRTRVVTSGIHSNNAGRGYAIACI